MKLNNNSINVTFISESAAKQIEEQLENLNESGGLIHAYDEVSSSLVNVCVKKQGKKIEVLSWSAYRPLSIDDAAREVATELCRTKTTQPTNVH